MDNDGDRTSTASTVSGIYRNILQSPSPLCMFYFAHPFGISTPPRRKNPNSTIMYQMTYNESNIQREPTKTREKCYPKNYDEERMATYIPWPQNTWNRDSLPPLMQLLAVRKARHNVPELETILKTIRSAWNTPIHRSFIDSRVRDFSASSTKSSYISSKMGSQTHFNVIRPGLLKRRYSVPEIIMRKYERYTLAQQKTADDFSSAVTPYKSPISQKLKSSNCSSRSDSNISRNSDCSTSIRQQLLQRFWSKEFRHFKESRSDSWPFGSPSGWSQRRLHEVSERCIGCLKLEKTCNLESKRVKLNSSPPKTYLQSGIDKRNLNCLTSSSQFAASCSSEKTETTEANNSVDDTQHDFKKNGFVYMTSNGTSFVDENECEGTSFRDDNESEFVQQLPQASIPDQRKSTGSIYDDRPDYSSKNDESINNSSTGEDSENKNDLSRKLNDLRTGQNMEENRNNMDGVDQYVSRVLVNSLNSLMDTVNEPSGNSNGSSDNDNLIMYKTSNRMNKQEQDCFENVTETYKVDKNINNSIANIDECNADELTDNAKLFNRYQQNSIHSNESDVLISNTITGVDDGRLIYFPHYTTESKDDESIISTQLSEKDYLDSHDANTIHVQTGSSYPNYNLSHGVIASRIVHRTSSMEAEPSSASPRENYGNESDASLVDSLDERVSTKSTESIREMQSICPVIEKSQSFFIPIIDGNQQIVKMPKSLRDKLAKRQQNLVARKQKEIHKKQKKIKKIVNRNQVNNFEAFDSTINMKSYTNDKQNIKFKNTLSGDKGKNTFLRSEIGMLESYRIDSRGNMLLLNPQKSDAGISSVKRSSQSVKNTYQQGDIVNKRSQTKKCLIDTRRKEVIKDVQHITLVTPDTECGPRRMYQKTEIRDGEKRIEILEIVECLDSNNPTDVGLPQELTYRTRSATIMRKSKIPIPVRKVGQSIGFQKSKDGCNPSQIFIKNIQQLGNNTKVDRMIADLLIEALNHPKEMGIEIVTSPKEFSRACTGIIKRPLILRRNVTGSRQSAGGTKYQQVFDVIPEEKSSFSVDSEESNFNYNINQINNVHIESREISIQNVRSSENPSTSESLQTIQKISGEKKMRENDILSSTAWLGFFKQHDDSLVDIGNQDDQQRNAGIANFIRHSSQQKIVKVFEKSSKPFNSPCSPLLLTPISSVDLLVSTCTSENILPTPSSIGAPEDQAEDKSVHFDTNVLNSTHTEPICTEYQIMENNLKDKVEDNRIELKLVTSDLKNYNTFPKETKKSTTSLVHTTNEIQKYSVQNASLLQIQDINNFPSPQEHQSETTTAISTESFIVLQDHEKSLKTAKFRVSLPSSRNRCIECCFCNPDLHKADGAALTTICMFCNKGKSLPKTIETETKSTNTARVYENLFKSDHIKTESEESDTVSLKCRKANSRTRHFPENAEEKIKENKSTKINLSTKPSMASTILAVKKTNLTEATSPSHMKNTKTTPIRLPSPFVSRISSQSYDSTSNSSSSCSNSSPKKFPVLPAGRWQNSANQKKINRIRSLRYKDVCAENDKEQMPNKNDNVNVLNQRQGTGWSLTLAGTYNEDMAPDVEMRLSFPRKNGNFDSEIWPSSPKIINSHNETNDNSPRELSDLSNENYNLNNRTPLLSSGNANVNPKRTLSKSVFDKKNQNVKNYNLPELSSFHGTVAQETAKKTIKRSGYSVAVHSATRTISNFSHQRQRAMSFKTLNTNARFDNIDRRRHQSTDLGNLSSHRLSIDSQTPSDTILSVLGKSVAPEQKPRVPTMSEKDLTRKQNICFTRNCPFFS